MEVSYAVKMHHLRVIGSEQMSGIGLMDYRGDVQL